VGIVQKTPHITQAFARWRLFKLAGVKDLQVVIEHLKRGRFGEALNAAGGDKFKLRMVVEAAFDPQVRAACDGINLIVAGEVQLITGDAHAAEATLRLPLPNGETHPYFYDISLGWCLLAQGKKEEARRLFAKYIKPLEQDDGTIKLAEANDMQATAAYFLDLLSEMQFVERAGADKGRLADTYLMIGQRHEIEGKPDKAIKAYEQAVSLGEGHCAAYARWRLIKLREAPSQK
jgi:tetratricopeptide (TPR) repeat protein